MLGVKKLSNRQDRHKLVFFVVSVLFVVLSSFFIGFLSSPKASALVCDATPEGPLCDWPAATKADLPNSAAWKPEQRVKSALYLRTLQQCFSRGSASIGLISSVDITVDIANTPDKWKDYGVFGWDNVRGAGAIIDSGDDGELGCHNDANWISNALNLWGYNSPLEFLCSIGYYRISLEDRNRINTNQGAPERPGSYNDCINGTGEYFTHFIGGADGTLISTFIPQGGSLDEAANRRKSSVSTLLSRLNSQKGITTALSSGVDLYWLYLNTFTADGSGSAGCRATPLKPLSQRTESDNLEGDPRLFEINYVNPTDNSNIREPWIFRTANGRDANSKVRVAAYIENLALFSRDGVSSPQDSWGENTCQFIADAISANSRAWKQAADNGDVAPGDQGSEGAPGGGGDNQTACNITGFGWIVCQTMGAISWATESLYSWIESQLILNPLSQTDAYGNQTLQYIAWQAMRNIANVVLVIGFLIIIFSQLTGAGVSNYGVKKLLPRLVIVAIAINISFLVMQIAVDVVNIIGVSIQPLLQSATPEFITNFGKTAEDMMAGIGIFSATALAGAAFAVGAGGLGAAVIIALLFIFGAFLSLVAAIFTIFIRNAAVIILAVIAPIAFAAYLLPNTEKLFDQWRKLFTSMLFLYPVVALLFGGAGFAAVVVAGGTETEWWQPFVGMFIAAAPLAALPFILRSSNKILGAVGGGLQNLAKRGSKATRDGIQPFLDRRKAEYQSGQRRWIGGYRSQQAQSRRRTLGQALNDRKLTDQMIAQGATNVAQQNIIRKGQQGVAAGGKQARSGAARAVALSNTNTALTQANQGLAQANINRALATPVAQGGLQNLADQIHDAELEAEEQKQIIRRRNTRRVANLNIEDVEGQSTVSGRRLSEIVQKTRADNEQASATELKIDHNTLTGGDAETRQDIAEGIQEQARLKPEIENVLSGINQVVDIQKSIKGTREEAAESERRAYDQSSKTRQDEQHANFAERIVEGTTQEDERLRSIASGAIAAAAPADNLRANLTGPLDQEEQEQFDLIRGQLLDNANVSTAATRATAQAVQVTDESKQRAIAAEGVVLRNRGYSPKDDIIPKLRNKENPNADGQPATPEQLMAMIQYVGQNGTVKEIAEMTDILSDSSYSPAQNPQYDGVIKFFGQTLKSTGRVKSIGAGAVAVLEQGKQIGRFSSLIADRINGGKLGPEAIAGMEVDEIDLYIDHFNSTPRTADGIGKISNERVDQFKKDIDERINNEDLKRSLTPEITEKLAALKKAIDNPQPKT